MWKFIQNNKIKEVRKEDTFNRAFYIGEFVEDTDHTVDDYVRANEEYVLKTSDEASEQKKSERIAELQSLLNKTDWYAVRYAETGVEIPDEIKVERQAAREEISRLRDNG